MTDAGSAAMIELPRSDSPRVTIAVIATRDSERLERCLEAIARNAPPAIAVEVILVVNDATAEVRRLVAELVRGARLVDPGVNAGTAGGWNLALAGARGSLLHILHEDTEVQEGWLEPLVRALDEHPEAAAVGSRLLNPDGTLQNVGWVAWRDGWVTQICDEVLPEAASIDSVIAVDHISSASMLVRCADLHAVGGFEERLSPGTFVDAYLGMALWRRGRATLVAPASVVRHDQGAMVSQDGDPYASEQFRMWLFLRNIEQFRELASDVLADMEPRAVDTLAHEGFDAQSVRRVLARAEARRSAAAGERPAPGPPAPYAEQREWGPSDEERSRLMAQRARDERAFAAWLVEQEGRARASLEELLGAAANWEREHALLREEYERLAVHAKALEERAAPAARRWRRRRSADRGA